MPRDNNFPDDRQVHVPCSQRRRESEGEQKERRKNSLGIIQQLVVTYPHTKHNNSCLLSRNYPMAETSWIKEDVAKEKQSR